MRHSWRWLAGAVFLALGCGSAAPSRDGAGGATVEGSGKSGSTVNQGGGTSGGMAAATGGGSAGGFGGLSVTGTSTGGDVSGTAGRGGGGDGSGTAGRGGGGDGSGIAGGGGAGGAAGQGGSAERWLPAEGGRVTGYGLVRIVANAKNQIVRLQTTLTVPPEPAASGTLFLWPGLQPGGVNFLPIDNGVLQPVLTWGRSCAPGVQPKAYSTWWISAQYVNTFGKQAGYTGCSGGPVMSVNVGDALDIDMQLTGTVWNQVVTDMQTGRAVSFAKDMMGQSQNLAYFDIEGYASAPVSEVIFTNTLLTFGSPIEADCLLSMRGLNDFVSLAFPSADGLQCFVPEIILRADGIP